MTIFLIDPNIERGGLKTINDKKHLRIKKIDIYLINL